MTSELSYISVPDRTSGRVHNGTLPNWAAADDHGDARNQKGIHR